MSASVAAAWLTPNATLALSSEAIGLRPGEGRIKDFSKLKADGSTCSGCWIYSGVYDGENKANKRAPKGRYGHGWGFAWLMDRRILYNRCSAAPDGSPWSERKKLVWWDEAKGVWTGDDVPDFTKKKRPDSKGDEKKGGDEALPGDAPFIMHPDGAGWIWVASGLKDGPLPAHYEPLESKSRMRSIRSSRRILPPIGKSGRTIATRDRRIRSIRTSSRRTA